MYVVFEGIDGAGKTTLAKIVTRKLNRIGGDAYYVAEPYVPQIRALLSDNSIRLTPLERVWAFYIDRLVLHRFLAKERPEFIVSDRSFVSSMVYQSGDEIGYEEILRINRLIPRPDLIVYVDTPIDYIRDRLGERRVEYNIEEMERLKQKYEEVLRYLEDEYGIEVYRVTNVGDKRDVTDIIVKHILSRVGVDEDTADKLLDGELHLRDLMLKANIDDVFDEALNNI